MRTNQEHLMLPMTLSSHARLESLRLQIQRIEKHGYELATTDALPFGLSDVDEHLTGGGLSLGVLHEVSAGPHPAHDAAMILFVSGILARLSGPVLWCLRQADLFAPGIAAVGLDESRVHYVEARDDKTLLLLMEEGLHHKGLAGVVGEVGRLSLTSARRLHLAARTSGVTAFVLHRTARFAKEQKTEPTAAESRWCVSALPSTPLPVAGIGRSRWKIDLIRSRKGEARSWEVEGCDEKGYVTLPAELANRSVAQTRTQLSA